jgi:hypothetical protein
VANSQELRANGFSIDRKGKLLAVGFWLLARDGPTPTRITLCLIQKSSAWWSQPDL